MKRLILMVLLLVTGISNIEAQKVLKVKSDTVVVLNKSEITILNKIASERDYLLDELEYSDSIIEKQESIIKLKEIEIAGYKDIVSSDNKIQSNLTTLLEDQIRYSEKLEKKVKRTRFYGLLGILLSIILL